MFSAVVSVLALLRLYQRKLIEEQSYILVLVLF